MNANDLHDLNVKINEAGVTLGEVNDGYKAVIDAGTATEAELAPALAPLRRMTGKLEAIQGWANAQRKAPADETPAAPVYEDTSDVPGKGFTVMSPEQVNSVLAKFDACIAQGREDWAYYGLTTTEEFALQNRGVKRAAINQKINQYNGQAAPRDLASSPRQH